MTTYVEYSTDEHLRAELYPHMESREPSITIGGFRDEKAFSSAALPSAMIKHMSEKGHLTREATERKPSQLVTASAVVVDDAIAVGIQIVTGILGWIQANPGIIDWFRNGLDFWRLDQYNLLVYRVKDKGVFLEFTLARPR